MDKEDKVEKDLSNLDRCDQCDKLIRQPTHAITHGPFTICGHCHNANIEAGEQHEN